MTTKLCFIVIHYVYNLDRTIKNYSDKNLQRKYTYFHRLKALAAEKNGTNPTNNLFLMPKCIKNLPLIDIENKISRQSVLGEGFILWFCYHLFR